MCTCNVAISVGHIGDVPYDSEDIVVELNGLSRNIDFKRPSLYGMRQLQTIIANKLKFDMHGKFKTQMLG